MINCGDCNNCNISKLNPLGVLNLDEFNSITSNMTTIFIKEGETLIEEGKIVKGLYCVKKGKFKASKLNLNGRNQILYFLIIGNIVGHRTIFSNNCAGLTITAMEASEVCLLPKNDLNSTFHNNPKFSLILMKNISHQLDVTNSNIAFMAQSNISQKLALSLLKLENLFGIDEDKYLNIYLSRQEYSDLIGSALETTMRQISSFGKEKIIEIKGKKIKIIDKMKIQNIANGFR